MANTIKIIQQTKIFDIGYDIDRKKTQRDINAMLNDGWKIKEHSMSNNRIFLIFEKEKL